MSSATTEADSLRSFEEESASGGYEPIKFQADSALIRELGERLVGAPHVALAELVKNAYDADATRCVVRLEPDRIVVSDNGHGMEESEFRSLWMIIGTTNKQKRGTSRKFHRSVTGSKGVGRLSAQFLAHKLQLVTKPEKGANKALHALVDWDEAVEAGDLTEAEARFRLEDEARTEFPEGSPFGTTVVMERLKQSWSEKDVAQLGRQLWMIQSPFPRFGRLSTGSRDSSDFEIVFETLLPGLDDSFARQMRAAIDSYYAAVEGKIVRQGEEAVSHVNIRFRDGEEYSETFPASALINHAEWQIRVYDLQGRQESGVPVQTAREYFEKFGVMMFDAGFRLPYYGVTNDWLEIEYDHAHRRSRSQLLPGRLQFERALNDLPSQGRLLGVVRIDTGAEARAASLDQHETGDYLKILVTRDRLVDNGAYRSLKRSVRQSLDFYATRQRSRMARWEVELRPYESPAIKLRRLDQLLHRATSEYPLDETIAAIRHEVESLDIVVEQQRRADEAVRGLLGPLASAGMAALAMEHENRKEIRLARRHLRTLIGIAETREDSELQAVANDFTAWLNRFEAGRKIFAPLLDSDEREKVEALPAAGVVREIASSIGMLLPGVQIETRVPRDISLPPATFAEWHAVLQNVLLNAGNAVLDQRLPMISITGGRTGRSAWLHVSDTGTGVDLGSQAELFEPFTRRQKLSEERAALGLGGMGLGLTIVRMIADERGCTAHFVEPEHGWSTTFELKWTEAV